MGQSKRAKCKHLNCEISEFYLVSSTWIVEHGFISDQALHDTGGGELQPYVSVKCKTCGMHRKYNRFKRVPAWLKQYIDGAFIVTDASKDESR